MRSTSEEQKWTWEASQARNRSPRGDANRSIIAARRGPLSGTSSVGITYSGGPSGSRSKRACAAVRGALHDHDAAVERAGAVGRVHGRRAQGAQQHAGAELQHALGELVPAVGAFRPVGPTD